MFASEDLLSRQIKGRVMVTISGSKRQISVYYRSNDLVDIFGAVVSVGIFTSDQVACMVDQMRPSPNRILTYH